MSEQRLEQLRRRIRNLDAALLGLVAERMELAREVGREKRSTGVPLRDFEVEKRVLERAQGQASELGLAPELARAVMHHLIEEACRLQELERSSATSGGAESVLLIGGAGKMGRWLAHFLESQGHRVAVHDPRAEGCGWPVVPSLAEGLAWASMVFVAVPLEQVGETIEEVAAHGYRGVLCDLASLKEHLHPALEAACRAGVEVTSIHPMFGPGVRTLSDRVIVVCDCGVPSATARVVALFRETAVTLVPLSLERHDEIAAYVLGLSHLLNLLFARVLERSGLELHELQAVGSTTFQNQLATTASVVGESPDLYFAIQRRNRFTARIYDELRRAAAEWTGWVERDAGEAFAGAMSDARAWLARG